MLDLIGTKFSARVQCTAVDTIYALHARGRRGWGSHADGPHHAACHRWPMISTAVLDLDLVARLFSSTKFSIECSHDDYQTVTSMYLECHTPDLLNLEC